MKSRVKKATRLITIFFILLLASHCDDDNPVDPDNLKFSRDILPILNEYGDILRQADVFPEGLRLTSWEDLMLGWERGEAVIPFDPDNSLLVELTTKLLNNNGLAQDKLDLLIRWIRDGAQNDAGNVPFDNSPNLLYVCDQAAAQISVIDTDAKVVIRTVNLLDLNMGFSLSSQPHFVAVEPDGSAWYVSLINENKVLKFNRANEFIGSADVSITALLAAHPTNDLLYVSRFPTAPGGDQPLVGVVDRASMTTRDDIVVRPTPHAMTTAGDGSFVYTCSLTGNLVVPINPVTNEADEPFVDLGPARGPIQLAVSPDNTTLAVSAQLSGEVFFIDVSDPDNRTITRTVPVNAAPWHIAFTPDGSTVYVPNNGANTISAIDVATGNVTVIGDGTGRDGVSQPHGIAVSRDGDFVYVSSRNILGAYKPRFDFGDNASIGTVVVINTQTNAIDKIVEVENFGSGMAVSQP